MSGTKISELPKISKIPEGDEMLFPVGVIVCAGGIAANYKTSISELATEIADQVSKDQSVEVEFTDNGLRFSRVKS